MEHELTRIKCYYGESYQRDEIALSACGVGATNIVKAGEVTGFDRKSSDIP